MATTLREFLIKLGVDADEKKLKTFDARLESVKKSATGVIRVLKGVGVGVGGILAGLLAGAKVTGEFSANLDEAARTLGVTTTELQELHFAAEQFDIPAERFNEAMIQMTGRLGEMADGEGEAADKMKMIGLNARQLAKMKPAEMFDKFADAIARSNDETKQVVATTGVFGDNLGEQILPMLRLGTAGLAKMRKEAHALGVIMSGPQIKAAKAFHLQWKKITSVLRSFRNQLALAVIPKLTEAANKTLKWVTANRKWINEKIDQAVETLEDAWDSLYEKLKIINKFVEEKIGGWGNVFRVIGAALAAAGIFKTISAIASVVQLASAAWGILAGILAGAGVASFGAIIAVVIGFLAQAALMILVLDDIMTYFRGGDSLIGRFIEWGKTADGVTGKIARAISGVAEFVKELALSIEDILGGAFEALGIIAEPIIDAMTAKLEKMWEWISEKIAPAVDWVGDLFERFGESASEAADQMKRGRESGEFRANQRGNAEMIAGRLRSAFGAAQTQQSADGTRAANENVANSMASNDTYHITASGQGDAQATATSIRGELEDRDREKRRQAHAMFGGGRR